MSEIVDFYNNARQVVATGQRHGHMPAGLNKLSVQAWFLNSNGELLLQQRPNNTKKYSNMWGKTGGGARAGESSWAACVRECVEEIGIAPKIENATLVGTFKRSRKFFDVWLIEQDIDMRDIVMQPTEVQHVQWVTPEQISDMESRGMIMPSSCAGYEMLIEYLHRVYPNKFN